MASNSKKRRRVLRVSCILAALIIAGSSFAWFTSKDEVTNRLTASADYNVSVIENFAPPKQWTPGQVVKKEEAVTNTGNIDAFVKQMISGALEITVEVPTTAAPDAVNKPGYITLDEAEYGSIEAGSYLAWSPNADEIGRKIVQAFTDDQTTTAFTSDFKPKTTGLYIFRRAITTTLDGDKNKDTKYEYVGYYYVAKEGDTGGQGTYYKLNSIDKTTLALSKDDEGNVLDGNLASAPTVRYAKETTKAFNKVPMTFEAATTGDGAHGDRLVISYNKEADGDTTSMNENLFKAYKAYLDQLQGKTTWDKSLNGDGRDSSDTDNKTGLIDNDKYEEGNTNKAEVDPDLTNWSLNRLTDRKTETEKAVALASPVIGEETVDWDTAYQNAYQSRKKVNRGVQAASELATLKSEVTNAIGAASNATDPGLYQAPNYTFHYSSTAVGTTPLAPTVQLLNTVDADGILTGTEAATNENGTVLAADTIDEASVADQSKDGVHWAEVVKPYATGTNSTLQQAWDRYEEAVKNEALLVAKIAVCDKIINANVTTGSTTSIGRSDGTHTEPTAYKAWLNEQLTTLRNGELKGAKEAYETLRDQIGTKIDQMNALQDEVNLANEVDNGVTVPNGLFTTAPDGLYMGNKDADNSEGYPTDKSTVHSNGATDTMYENILKKYLMDVYGVAYTDQQSDTEKKNDYYQPTAASSTDGKSYLNHPTYSPTVTKEAIDGSLEADAMGKIKWKTTLTTPVVAADEAAIGDSLYYADKKVGFMKVYRQTQVDAKKAAYDVLAAQSGEVAASADVTPIKIYVNLANIAGETPAVDQWQYIANATGDNEFNFYYTGILGSGETSKLLIKSVEMSPDTQDTFRNLQFDLNVEAQSAQAVYEGDDLIYSTAAIESITGADPTATTYGINDTVVWAADGTNTTPTDEDPNPKADKTVAAEETSAGGGEGGAGGGSETPATTPVDVIVTGADAEHNLIKMVKTGTGDTATWAVADSGSTITDAASGYHYTVNGSGIYRSVTGLTVALNAVTGDTTPVVAYVAD